MLTPKSRGSLSETLFATLPHLQPEDELATMPQPDDRSDEQVALWALYELHYRGFEDAHPALDWHPDLLRLRRDLERVLELRLRCRFAAAAPPAGERDFAASLFGYIEAYGGRS